MRCTSGDWDPEQVGVLRGDSLWRGGAPPGPPSHEDQVYILGRLHACKTNPMTFRARSVRELIRSHMLSRPSPKIGSKVPSA